MPKNQDGKLHTYEVTFLVTGYGLNCRTDAIRKMIVLAKKLALLGVKKANWEAMNVSARRLS